MGLDGSEGVKRSGSRSILKTELTGLMHYMGGEEERGIEGSANSFGLRNWMNGMLVVEQVWNTWIYAGKQKFSLGYSV